MAPATEWELTDDGRWRAVDPADEMRKVIAAFRDLASRNRERIADNHALCARIRQRLRIRQAWCGPHASPTPQ